MPHSLSFWCTGFKPLLCYFVIPDLFPIQSISPFFGHVLQEHKEYFLGLGIYNHVLLQIALFTKIINGINLLIYFTLDVIEYVIEEVTADHPEVLSIIKETVEMAKDMNFEQPHEKIAEILDEVLQEVRNPGSLFLSLISQ